MKIYTFLRWSEKYTRTDMVYLTKGGFWISFGQTLTNLLSLGLLIALANLLPQETYGTYKYILAIAGILSIFSLTGASSAITQSVATGKNGILIPIVKYQLKWNVMMLVAFWILASYYLFNGNPVLTLSFFILGVFVPITTAFQTYGSYLSGKKNFKLSNIFNVISTFIYVVGMLATVLLSPKIVLLIAMYALTTFVSSIIFLVITLRIYKPLSESADETIKYSRKLTFINLIGPIATQLDNIILTHFWGASQLAVYAIAMAIPNRATAFIKSWVYVAFPKLSVRTPQEINSMFYRRISQGVILGIIIAVAYVITAPFIFHYVLPQYTEAIIYSQILSIGFIFALPNRFVSILLVTQKLARIQFINNSIQSVLKICLYLLLGIWGGILGLVIAQVLIASIGLVINVCSWRLANKNTS